MNCLSLRDITKMKHKDIQYELTIIPSPLQRVREFAAPEESLEKTLESNRGCLPFRSNSVDEASPVVKEGNSTFYSRGAAEGADERASSPDTGNHFAFAYLIFMSQQNEMCW